jgi:diaminohydroxyphosphoribosylaminopyrimidine deaminase / 5-amino-6-(5-phosphoribosylamino)uracil reductase
MLDSAAKHDPHFMQRALELANKGLGLASPNPTVGCVIVKDRAIIGEGFHQYANRDHAEVVALRQAGTRARGATAYITLEPCNHTGRTGPCSEALIAAGISRVVAAMQDPNPKVSGASFERLRQAGIEVTTGILENEAQEINEAFSWWITRKLPFVTLKSALTLDGQLTLFKINKSKRSAWITSEESRAEVQLLRHASDALLTGFGTVLADDPLLTDRSGLPRRRKLLRVILDSKLRLSPKARIVTTADDDVLVFTGASLDSPRARKLQESGIRLVRAKISEGRIHLTQVLRDLGHRDILSVLLEAGPTLNSAALLSGLVNRITLFYAPKLAGNRNLPLARVSQSTFAKFHFRSAHQVGPDVRLDLVR